MPMYVRRSTRRADVMLAIWIAVLCAMLPGSNTQSCRRPSSIPNRVRLQVSRIFPFYSTGTEIRLRCTGSTDILVGNDTIVCLTNGSWSAYPECIQVTMATTAPTAERLGNVGATIGMVVGLVFGILLMIGLVFGCILCCKRHCPGGCKLQCHPCPPVCITYDERRNPLVEYILCPCEQKESTQELNIEHSHRPSETSAGTSQSVESERNCNTRSTPTSSTNSSDAVSSQPRAVSSRQEPVIRTEVNAVSVNTSAGVSFTIDLNGDELPAFAFGGHRFRGNRNHGEDQPLRQHPPPGSFSSEQTSHFEPVDEDEEIKDAIHKESVLSEAVPPSYGFVVRNDAEYPAVDKDLPPAYNSNL